MPSVTSSTGAPRAYSQPDTGLTEVDPGTNQPSQQKVSQYTPPPLTISVTPPGSLPTETLGNTPPPSTVSPFTTVSPYTPLSPYTPPVAPLKLPAPSPTESAPPEGTGLTLAGPDWPPNSVKTAGGYTIVPGTDNASWSIFAPGQKASDTPNTHINGDPHVHEADGTAWDFSKSSAFRLPDGTQINVTTTAQEGHSLCSSLDITNGADHAQITGIDQDKPVLGDITHDGYQFREAQAAEDTFTLGGNKDNVQWFKQDSSGALLGEVLNARDADGNQTDFVDGSYVQAVDPGSQYVVDPSLRPEVGTPAWGNMLHSMAVDAQNGVTDLGAPPQTLTGSIPKTTPGNTTGTPAAGVASSSAGVTAGAAPANGAAAGQDALVELQRQLKAIEDMYGLVNMGKVVRFLGGI
jgi:hypothetical protein